MRCFFIGHRDAGMEVFSALQTEVERHIVAYGVHKFYVGNYGSFDHMAARAVIKAKEKHPEVRLYMVLPYHPAVRRVSVPPGFDGSYFPEKQENVPPRLAIIRANEQMVCSCDYLIAHVKYPSGGAGKVLEIALRRQKRGQICVTNLSG